MPGYCVGRWQTAWRRVWQGAGPGFPAAVRTEQLGVGWADTLASHSGVGKEAASRVARLGEGGERRPGNWAGGGRPGSTAPSPSQASTASVQLRGSGVGEWRHIPRAGPGRRKVTAGGVQFVTAAGSGGLEKTPACHRRRSVATVVSRGNTVQSTKQITFCSSTCLRSCSSASCTYHAIQLYKIFNKMDDNM